MLIEVLRVLVISLCNVVGGGPGVGLYIGIVLVIIAIVIIALLIIWYRKKKAAEVCTLGENQLMTKSKKNFD